MTLSLHAATIIAAFVLGAVIGSFLNVCIFRIPREISLLNPARSFCPHCKKIIPWHQNVPLVAWIILRGRCAQCHAPIRFAYFVVELVTGLLFALAAWLIAFPETVAIWILISFLVVATFVDIDFFIIPNVVTKGGIAAGLILSAVLPELHGTSSRWVALGASGIGIVIGVVILYLVSELGKLAFGRYKVRLEKLTAFKFENVPPDNAIITIDDEAFHWSEHFFRKTDRAKIRATSVEINGTQYHNIDLIFFYNRLVIGEQIFPLEHLEKLNGQTSEAEFPREAMGLGDVKLIGAIGAFVGWPGVLFAIPAAAFIGAAYGLTATAIGKREWSAKIPFGPYLAAGSLLWVFQGQTIINWYLQFLRP